MYIGECKVCKEKNKIIQNSRGVCIDCVFKENHNGLSKFEFLKKKKNKTLKKRKKKSILVYKEKGTRERDLFLKIWEEREHICSNCKKKLGGLPKPIYFSHIKSKGAHPELKFDENNIEILCEDCHYAHEFIGDDSFNRRKNLYLKLE